jgi:hypothetical protein
MAPITRFFRKLFGSCFKPTSKIDYEAPEPAIRIVTMPGSMSSYYDPTRNGPADLKPTIGTKSLKRGYHRYSAEEYMTDLQQFEEILATIRR